MVIFPRRIVQELLSSLSGVIPRHPLEQIMHGLNAGGEKSLASEWEVVVLATVSRAAKIKYEEPTTAGKRPDLHATPKDGSPSLVAEITTVSDKGYAEQNPYDLLTARMGVIARERGLTLAGFDVQAGAEKRGRFGSQRVWLALPRTSPQKEEFETEFRALVDGIAKNRARSAKLIHKRQGVDLRITYTPGKPFLSGGHLTYTTTYGIENNPVYGALKRKKKQLRSIIHDLRDVIICDGNCDLLRSENQGAGAFSLQQVVQRYLSMKGGMDFVACLAVREPLPSVLSGSCRPPFINRSWYVHPSKSSDEVRGSIQWLDRALSGLPVPSIMPYNAVNRLRSRMAHKGESFIGRWDMSESRIRISSSSPW